MLLRPIYTNYMCTCKRKTNKKTHTYNKQKNHDPNKEKCSRERFASVLHMCASHAVF